MSGPWPSARASPSRTANRSTPQAVKANIDDALSAPLSGIALKGLITSTTVVDASTVKVNLDRPWASFPTSFLTSQVAFMMAPAMLAQPDGGQNHPIGTGPFTFDDWTVGTKVKTSRNDNYWRPGEPHLNELDFLVIGDSVSQIDALRSGDVDMITTQDPEAPNKLGDSYQMVKNWTTEPSMVVTNTLPEVNGAPNPLANQHARLALAYATDRASLAAQFGAGVVSPTSPFSPGSVWGQPTDQNGYVDFDLEKAKNEVELYKQDTGGKDLSLTLTGEAATTGQLVQVLQQQWQNASIHTTLETLESAAFISQVVVGKFQLAVFPIYTAPDPDQNYFIWTSTNVHPEGELSINFAHLKSDVIDKDLEIGHANPDHDARKAGVRRPGQGAQPERREHLALLGHPHTGRLTPSRRPPSSDQGALGQPRPQALVGPDLGRPQVSRRLTTAKPLSARLLLKTIRTDDA